jgi:2-aminoadipate transaminase
MAGSAIRELLRLTDIPGLISFAGGLPAPEVFPVAEIAEASARVLRDEGARALQYSATEGYQPLRQMIARHTDRYGFSISPSNVMITSGSQQALDLIGKLFINRGDRILVESPTYLGALQAWNAYGAEYIPVPVDEDGMIPDALEAGLRSGPKFIYVLPNFQNPTGVTLSLERRRLLVDLADRYGVPIVEDDPYGQLRYEGEHLPPVVVLDEARTTHHNGTYQGNVIYLSTFSKILAPGIRLGWVIAPPQVIDKLVMAKQGMDLHTATFNQMVVHEAARGGFLDRHVQAIRRTYKQRRDVMLSALDEHAPAGVTWTHPSGGLFLWLTLPPDVRTEEVFRVAVENRVAFVPGASFHPCGGGHNTIRLNFSYMGPELIREGIARLGRVLQAAIYEPPGALAGPAKIGVSYG